MPILCQFCAKEPLQICNNFIEHGFDFLPPPFITKMLEKLQYCRGMASLIVSSAPRMMAGLWSSLYFPDFDLWLLSDVMDGMDDDSDEDAKQRQSVMEWHYAMRH